MKKKTVPAAIVLAAALSTVSAPAANATFTWPSHGGTVGHHDSTKQPVKEPVQDAHGTKTENKDVVKDIHGVIWTKIYTWTKFGWSWKWYC